MKRRKRFLCGPWPSPIPEPAPARNRPWEELAALDQACLSLFGGATALTRPEVDLAEGLDGLRRQIDLIRVHIERVERAIS